MKSAEFVAHFERTFPHLIGQGVLVALSGGRDSVALLHLLMDPGLDLRLEAAHVHHGLRGAEADDDAAFCRRLSSELEIPFQTLQLPPDDGSPATGEAAWRRRRYRALHEHAADRGIPAIATAHHRDDVAEGVLMQLLRGAGPRAMAGIAGETTAGIIRPLLPWGRKAIDRWLASHDLTWRDDSSNTDLDRLRNRVRHVVLPGLETDTPRIRRHLVRLAEALAEGETFMAEELHRRTAFADPWEPGGGVELETLRPLARALRSRWLHGQMRRLGIDRTTRRQLELFHELLDTGTPRSVAMGGRWRLRAARGRIWAEPPTPLRGAATTLEPDASTPFGVPGWQARLGTTLSVRRGVRWTWRPPAGVTSLVLRPAADDDELPGDAGGRRRAKKVIAEKLPRHLRAAWPVFCENDMIYWIPGVWQHPDPGDPSDRVVEVIRR